MIKTTRIVLACLFLTTNFIYSQETIPTSGGEASGSGGSLSYSVGQLVYSAYTATNGNISEGIQQSIELSILSNPELITVSLKAVSYPNPATDYVVLALTDADLTNLTYILYDIQGRQVTKGAVILANTKIDLQGLATGAYILKVNQYNQELKTFKIIKN